MSSKIRTLLPPKLANSEAAAGAEASSKEIHLEEAIWQLYQWWVRRIAG